MCAAMVKSFLNQLKIELQRIKPRRQPKTHDYSRAQLGSDYIFETIEEGQQGYMTGQGQGMKLGDYVLLPDNSYPCQYQVEKIDYYCNQPDIWIALLRKVESIPYL